MTELPEYCANTSTEHGGLKCKARCVPGHIYCDPCRIAVGGYDRTCYTPRSNTHKQEH